MKRGIEKRGLSDVITTLIMIGISIIAIGIVWAVISSIISGSSNQVNIDKLTVKLDVTSAVMTPNGLEVSVKRDPGTGNISNLALVVSDGLRKETFLLNQTLEELQEKKFTLNYFGIVTNVEIVPFFSGQSGAIISGDVADTLKFGPSQTIKNIPGLVSWYRFEGNSNDEMGLNNGVVIGSTLVDGKFGKAYRFTAPDADFIRVNDATSLRLENSNMSILAWINKTSSGAYAPIISKGDIRGHADPGYFVGTTFVSSTKIKPSFGTPDFNVEPKYNLTTKTWEHLTTSQTINSPARTLKIYHNGNLINQTTKNSVIPSPSSGGYNLVVGSDNDQTSGFESFAGVIDEVMIFNRTLSDSEIAALYALDLS